jgi:hypothetical protein
MPLIDLITCEYVLRVRFMLEWKKLHTDDLLTAISRYFFIPRYLMKAILAVTWVKAVVIA